MIWLLNGIFSSRTLGQTRRKLRNCTAILTESSGFLDSRILYGDDFDAVLAKAQKASLVTLVLVSAETEHANYEREENG